MDLVKLTVTEKEREREKERNPYNSFKIRPKCAAIYLESPSLEVDSTLAEVKSKIFLWFCLSLDFYLMFLFCEKLV